MIHRVIATLSLCFMLGGCLSNDVKELKPGEHIPDWQNIDTAVIVYGIGLQQHWDYPYFTVNLAEYSLKDQNITGNCFHFNETEATIPSDTKGTRYFAFVVPAGYYSLSSMAVYRSAYGEEAFFAPAGSNVYVGNFIYVGNHTLIMENHLPDAAAATRQSLVPAQIVAVKPPRPLLCTP